MLKLQKTCKDIIDNKVAKFFFGCNIPFSTIERPLFVELVDALRPGYKLPSRKTLANKHLDEVTKEIEDDMKANLKGKKSVTLVEDGWSNIHNDPVIATWLNVDGRAYLLDAHNA